MKQWAERAEGGAPEPGPDAEGLRARLQTLAEAGAATYDAPACRFVEGLLARAADLPEPAAERLRSRAAERLDRLEAAFAQARDEAAAALREVEALRADRGGDLRAAFERGDHKAVLLGSPRLLRTARDAHRQGARARVQRLHGQLQARSVALPPPLRGQLERLLAEPDDLVTDLRGLGDQLARALFRDAAEHARSALVVARAADSVPAEVGPYNPQALAAEALALVESLSPAYLKTWLGGLEDLAALRLLPKGKRGRR